MEGRPEHPRPPAGLAQTGLPAATGQRHARPERRTLRRAGERRDRPRHRPALRRALAAALESHREVVLDLSEVTFMDCTGLGALVRARNQADRSGARLVLRGAGRRVVRLLKLTGLHRRLAVEP
ncbi:STAS domain-containing protein [Streptomyces sp. FH025]|uniref:STAS domain-containing protein n=1 Tax=Streptomyces sp. FH025 TaxID=2815937 RepID=UPI001A9D261F|nr:STAS domain-containing protein [Streptomyces sp. FH025]MBO1420243.1 STAS domain-containing protein [Streptomyces sp. FH025]